MAKNKDNRGRQQQQSGRSRQQEQQGGRSRQQEQQGGGSRQPGEMDWNDDSSRNR